MLIPDTNRRAAKQQTPASAAVCTLLVVLRFLCTYSPVHFGVRESLMARTSDAAFFGSRIGLQEAVSPTKPARKQSHDDGSANGTSE